MKNGECFGRVFSAWRTYKGSVRVPPFGGPSLILVTLEIGDSSSFLSSPVSTHFLQVTAKVGELREKQREERNREVWKYAAGLALVYPFL